MDCESTEVSVRPNKGGSSDTEGSAMRKILFVDAEPNILEGLQRMLFPLQQEWRMVFVASGAKALESMESQRFDVIVSDMRMPGMDGAQLLAAVKNQYPDTVRFVLTGQTDSEAVYRSVGDAHQFLNKPCKPKLLKECVDKAFAIRDLLSCDRLKSAIAQIGSLPPVPKVYEQLCEELQSAECSVASVSRIIETDQAILSKILQLVNSAFFGVRHRITSAAQASSMLGLQTLKSLVLMTGLFTPMQQASFPKGFSMDEKWRHSAKVGVYAEALCKYEGAPKEMVGDAYTAGLLHDAGELILAVSCPDDYVHVYDYGMLNQIPAYEAERKVLGCTHAELGAYLLGIWGLPDQIVEAVAYHHEPSESASRSLSPLAAVHAADMLDYRKSDPTADIPEPAWDMAFFARIGLETRLPQWREACKNIDAREEKQA